jgi:hypothetical protein
MFLSADKHLKPCCFLNASAKDFKKWAQTHNLNLEDDLDVTKHSIETILVSPTWIKLLDGFKDGDTPKTCHSQCGDNSYTSTTNTAKHSDYKPGK